MKSTNITDIDEVEKMVEIASEYCKVPIYSIKSNSRRMDVLLPRMVVSNIARFERGIHYNTISQVLNRDRCSIYHYQQAHKNNYKYWIKYRDLFNDIINTIHDKKLSVPVRFKTKKQLKSYILDNSNIKENDKGKVFISVRLDNLKTDIQTNYRDFSSTLSKIQYCLHDFNAKIDISL